LEELRANHGEWEERTHKSGGRESGGGSRTPTGLPPAQSHGAMSRGLQIRANKRKNKKWCDDALLTYFFPSALMACCMVSKIWLLELIVVDGRGAAIEICRSVRRLSIDFWQIKS
jgi:hypothetical protein